jgi:hypothetical protein
VESIAVLSRALQYMKRGSRDLRHTTKVNPIVCKLRHGAEEPATRVLKDGVFDSAFRTYRGCRRDECLRCRWPQVKGETRHVMTSESLAAADKA